MASVFIYWRLAFRVTAAPESQIVSETETKTTGCGRRNMGCRPSGGAVHSLPVIAVRTAMLYTTSKG